MHKLKITEDVFVFGDNIVVFIEMVVQQFFG